jgi:WD40 repeat protein
MVVSGSSDQTVMVWDIRGMKLLRILDRHAGPVVAVSINSVNGSLCTLTSRELRLYTVNGELLATGNMNDNSSPKPRARVVLAPPGGEWQDGYVAVTGHDAGHVYLWKMNVSIIPQENGKKVLRELEAFALPKAHRSDITVLRLCTAAQTKSKPLIPRTYEGENMYELLVGDSEGFASRWTPGKLEQLNPNELQRRASEII